MVSDSNAKDSANTHPIEVLQALSPSQIALLKKRWIDTVEALLGIAANEKSRVSLGELLVVSPEGIAGLLKEAKEIVGHDRAQHLMSPQKGGPTGAALTDEQRTEFGMD